MLDEKKKSLRYTGLLIDIDSKAHENTPGSIHLPTMGCTWCAVFGVLG